VNRRKLLQSKRRGSAITLVMLVIVILLAIGTGLLSLGLHGRIFAIRDASGIAARCAADASLVKALFEMNEKLKVKPWDGNTLPQETDKALPNCDAIYSYTVTGNINSGHIIEAIGKSNQAERRAISTLRLQGPFEWAIFTDAGISLRNGTVVDWYHYDADDENLQIGTNSILSGAIDLKSGSIVNGDVVVGVGGDPDVVINAALATITGETDDLTEEYELPPITVPQYLQVLPSQGTISGNTTITSSAKYDEIDLGSGKIITIDGPVVLYVVGDIVIKNSAELQVVDANTNPDASLTMYLGGNLESKNGGLINNQAMDAKKLEIFALDSCQRIMLKNSSDFYGAIYAPKADVIFDNSADSFGSVIAKSFEQKNSSAFNYDASLRDVSIDDEALRFVIQHWSEW